jgi:dTDP-4-dehydrorhamnose reductase
LIWLIGNKGMLGTELSRLLENNSMPHTGTDREVDITDPAALLSFARAHSFDWIINCAAYTAVDKAEDDEVLCRNLNTNGAANIAKTAKIVNARLIHISTDYVFNGRGTRPYLEDDLTDPIGIYGLTKRDGEKAVLNENGASYIIRTAWLYGLYGNNFVKTMLRLMKEKENLSVVNDQQGSPTWAYDLAAAAIQFIRQTEDKKNPPYGIYHFTNEEQCTWFEFASAIYEEGCGLGILTKACEVKPCSSAEYPARVKRPAYSVLDKGKIKKTLGLEIPPWRESLKKYLETEKREEKIEKP